MNRSISWMDRLFPWIQRSVALPWMRPFLEEFKCLRTYQIIKVSYPCLQLWVERSCDSVLAYMSPICCLCAYMQRIASRAAETQGVNLGPRYRCFLDPECRSSEWNWKTQSVSKAWRLQSGANWPDTSFITLIIEIFSQGLSARFATHFTKIKMRLIR